MQKIIQVLIVIVTVSFIVIGCSSNDDDKIGIRGTVIDINVDEESAIITVEGKLEEDTMYDKAIVEITKDTMIQKDSMSTLFQISDIEKGSMVEVVFKGGIKESYPVQGTADIVRIVTQHK